MADGLDKPGLCSALNKMPRTAVDHSPMQQGISRSSPAANPTTTQGITPGAASVSAASPSQQAASPEQARSDDGKPGV